jgi:hypothetical protein
MNQFHYHVQIDQVDPANEIYKHFFYFQRPTLINGLIVISSFFVWVSK